MGGTVSIVDRVELLRRVDFFQGVAGHVLAALAHASDELALAEGDILLRQGEPGDRMFITLEGDLDVVFDGRTIDRLGAGAVVGELAVLLPEARTATVRCATPARFLVVAKETVDELLLDHPEMALGVITSLVRRVHSRNAHDRAAAGA